MSHHRSQVLSRLAVAESCIGLFLNKRKENRTLNRIKKLAHAPVQYTVRALAAIGLVSKTQPVRTFWGSRLHISLRDENALNIFFCGALGHTECRLTRFLIHALSDSEVFYDIGANYGFYSSLAHTLAPNGEIHCFEPSARTASCIQASFSGSERLVLNISAVSSTDGVATFYDTSETHKSGMSTIMKEAAENNTLSFKKVQVPSVTLDTYIQNHTPPTFIKLDVEGAEYHVLSGASRLLRDFSPTIAMEVWDVPHIVGHTKSALALLKAAGYESYRITPEGMLEPAEISLGSLREFNIFIFKKHPL